MQVYYETREQAEHEGASSVPGKQVLKKYQAAVVCGVGGPVMQTVFFGLCFVIDVARAGTSSFVTRLRDAVFTVLVFPVGTFVFLSFWLIYAYDRELVYPKYLDDIIPAWLNHAMHTVILPLLLVQLYLQPHRYPSKKKGIFGLAFFSAIYLAWLLWVHHASGIWVYPILAQLSPAGLMLFLAGSALALAPLYLLGERLSHLRWGKFNKKE